MPKRDPEIWVSDMVSVDVKVDLREHLHQVPTEAMESELLRRRAHDEREESGGDDPITAEQALLHSVAFQVRVLRRPLQEVLDDVMRQHDVDWQYTRAGEVA